ncbi:uncharacterized protein SPSK_06344 [Sporothrix schenckii 1099-18]|uniref:Peptide hydrolase n=2 Tax=Sporothrix schenckii TaxID=29908 RepID=U7PSU7_SPOS1|nr:uncharacterized protein SPSK_06344 [Sporothrix schenckii 1099-18]ERS98677.1 hypothetical protein HMPREF1624_05464 [Sporothrix schenckii ATCC 58251]KJR89134.1 hypothetical protein SPSK_06344 [Sporothrix schenckii 1099-18]
MHLSISLLASLALARYGLAYKPLSDNFLRQVPGVSEAELDPVAGDLLAPFLQPRAPGSEGHADIQDHLVQYFAANLPDWTVEWQNATTYTQDPKDKKKKFVAHHLANLVFRREPPWTRPGQANLLTLATHYATPSTGVPAGYVGATDAAVSCALLLHVARSLDRFAAQMYREMQELGEGGTVPMDMGLQVVFVDGVPTGKENDKGGATADVSGSKGLAAAWERETNPALAASLYGYPNRLNQISLLLLLDLLGGSRPRVPSRYQTTHWAYQAMARVEQRLRGLGLLTSSSSSSSGGGGLGTATDDPSAAFLPDHATPVHQLDLASGWATDRDDHIPFMRRGVAVLPVVPDAKPAHAGTLLDDGQHVDRAVVQDWSRILVGFALEWLDMMEVEPQAPAGRRRRRRASRSE